MYDIYKKKPQDQTFQEWQDDLSGNNKVTTIYPKNQMPNRIIGRKHRFKYLSHRTTKRPCLVLEFESLDESFLAVKFFNITLEGRKGIIYSTGANGQFNSHKRSKFRRFYKRVTGEEPARWSRVHKSLKSKFRDRIFTAEVEECRDSKDNVYYKIIESGLFN